MRWREPKVCLTLKNLTHPRAFVRLPKFRCHFRGTQNSRFGKLSRFTKSQINWTWWHRETKKLAIKLVSTQCLFFVWGCVCGCVILFFNFFFGSQHFSYTLIFCCHLSFLFVITCTSLQWPVRAIHLVCFILCTHKSGQWEISIS